MRRIVNDEALDTLFRAARSPRAWLARPVSDTLLRAVWELVKSGPTGIAERTARILFIRADSARTQLAQAVPDALRQAVATAPVAAIVAVAADRDQRPTAPLEAAYLILAARALGLDCLPIWDFDGATVDAAFFPEDALAANFVCALGYGEDAQLPPGEPHPALDEPCRIL